MPTAPDDIDRHHVEDLLDLTSEIPTERADIRSCDGYLVELPGLPLAGEAMHEEPRSK